MGEGRRANGKARGGQGMRSERPRLKAGLQVPVSMAGSAAPEGAAAEVRTAEAVAAATATSDAEMEEAVLSTSRCSSRG